MIQERSDPGNKLFHLIQQNRITQRDKGGVYFFVYAMLVKLKKGNSRYCVWPQAKRKPETGNILTVFLLFFFSFILNQNTIAQYM